MRRVYVVTVLVDVDGCDDRDFAAAVAHLRKHGVWLDWCTSWDDGGFCVKSRAGAVVKRRRAGKREGGE